MARDNYNHSAWTSTATRTNTSRGGALLFILIYLAILAAFWLNTYLWIWRS